MKPELTKISGGSVFRKIAMGSWKTAGDPAVYGLLELDVAPALRHLEKINQNSLNKISISHLVGKATAHVLQARPEINGMIRFSRIYQRKHVDLFYQINIPGDASDPIGKAMLSGTVIRKAEMLTVTQIAEELSLKSKALKSGNDGELTKSIQTLAMIPWWLMRTVLDLTSFLNFDLGWNMKWAGMPRDPFGSVMITNVGSMGIECAWAPLVPYTKVPLLVTVGTITPRAWVVENQVEVRPVMRIGITFDHRFMDGTHAAEMNRIFRECFAQPEKYF